MSFSTIAQKSNSGITNARDFLDEKANTILKPKAAEGISGFIFDVPDTESIMLSSDITDHYTEDNSFLNDHIVRKPVQITLSGFIGELVYTKPDGVEGAVQELNNRLEAVEAYVGDLTPGAVQTVQRAVQKVQSTVSAINQTLDKVQNVIGWFDGEGQEETAQQKAFNNLYALWKSADYVTVQTPWRYFDNMVIKDISFQQNGDTESITDISVTLKQIRVAQTKTASYDEDIFPVREQIQSGEEEDQGVVRGEERNVSLLYSAFGGGN